MAIVFLPNPVSVSGRILAPLFTPYANLFQFNTTWRFFSPDPSPNIYVEYEVMSGAVLDMDDDLILHRWPPKEDEYNFENIFRMFTSGRYVTGSVERMEMFLIPYLCRIHDYPEVIVVRGVMEEVPAIEKARRVRENFEVMNRIQEALNVSYYCQ